MVRPVLPSVYSSSRPLHEPTVTCRDRYYWAQLCRAAIVDFFPDQNLNEYSMLFLCDVIVPCLHAPQPTPDQKNPMLTTGVTRMLAKRRTTSTILALKIHPSRWRSRSTRHDCESPTRLWAGGGDVASRDDAARKRRRMAPCGANGCERSVSPGEKYAGRGTSALDLALYLARNL